MLLCCQRPPIAGRLLQLYSSNNGHLHSLASEFSPFKLSKAPFCKNLQRCRALTTTTSRSHDPDPESPRISSQYIAGDPRSTGGSGIDRNRWQAAPGQFTTDDDFEAPSFSELLEKATGPLSPGRLRTLALILFPDTQSPANSSTFKLPPDQHNHSKLRADCAIKLSEYKLRDVPRQLLCAQILSFYLKQELVSQKDWAQCLFRLAIEQYRALENISSTIDSRFYSECYQQYARLLDLMQLWHVFFRVNQPSQGDEIPLRSVIDHAANKLPPKASYQERLLAFLPEWKLGSDPQSDRYVVYSSFIILTILVDIRYKLLSGMSSNVGIGRASATRGSLLNIRNVSLLEAGFLHIVGRAAQSAPLNRIYLNLGLSQLGLTSHESVRFTTTVEHLHRRSEYLLEESQRSLSTIESYVEKGTLKDGLAQGQTDHKAPQGFLAEEGGLAHPSNATIVPIAFLDWIKFAQLADIRAFNWPFQKAAHDAIVPHGPTIFDAMVRRILVLASSYSVRRVADELAPLLKSWILTPVGKPADDLVRSLLGFFREPKNFHIEKYAEFWALLQKFKSARLRNILMADAKECIADHHSRGRYGQALKLHRATLTALQKELGQGHGGQRIPLSLELTRENLLHCFKGPRRLGVQGPEKPTRSQCFLNNLVESGVKPDRDVYRLMMRLSLVAHEFRDFHQAFRNYTELLGPVEVLDEESALYFRSMIGASTSSTGMPMKPILSVVSQAIRIWHGEPEQKPYFEQHRESLPADAWESCVKAHSRLLLDVCEMKDLPNQLKIAACIHKHLEHCIPIDHLSRDLESEVVEMEQRILRMFWDDTNFEEKLRFLGRHVYSREPGVIYEDFPIVARYNLVTKWLALRLKKVGRRLDLGSRRSPNLESHINYLLSGEAGARTAVRMAGEYETADSKSLTAAEGLSEADEHDVLQRHRSSGMLTPEIIQFLRFWRSEVRLAEEADSHRPRTRSRPPRARPAGAFSELNRLKSNHGRRIYSRDAGVWTSNRAARNTIPERSDYTLGQHISAGDARPVEVESLPDHDT